MAGDKAKGIKQEIKGYVNKATGSLTGNEARKAHGEAQITEGDNRKDLADQQENGRKGKTDPGNPTNL
nr:CsbD family protein [Paraburkholderia sp. XV]